MKRTAALVALTVLVTTGLMLHAQTTRKTAIYVPKSKSQSKQRTDGAARGGGDVDASKIPVVRVITPTETAAVASAQPTLYWYIDRPTDYVCDVVIKTVDDEQIATQQIKGVKQAGMVAFDVSKTGAKLEAGKDYRFAVFITMSKDPAADIECSGAIRYEAPTTEVQKAVSDAATSSAKAAAYAANGYFPDAVAELAKDSSANAKAELNDLLQQVELKDVKAE